MKVTFNYEKLLENLTDLSLVVEDVMSGEDMKNIIFRFTKDNITLVGINQLVTFKRVLTSDIYNLEIDDKELEKDGVAYMQIKSKELIGYLNSYKALRRTEVEDVELSLVNDLTVVCKVSERSTEDGQIYVSSYNFSNVPIKPNILSKINLTAPDEIAGDVIPMVDILLYTKNMLPLMKNDTGLFGQLVFGEDGVVVAFNAAFNTFMYNKLPASFNGIKLSYRAISFIDKIFSTGTELVAKKLDKYLYLYSEGTNSEAFITFDGRLPNYSVTKDLFVKDHAFVLDRVYLKDILKRLSLVNESVEFRVKCEEDIIEVKNSKFRQTIPILNKKALEEYTQINFKILPDTLNKVIIGDDAEFSPNVNIYYCPLSNNDAMLVFTDSSSPDGVHQYWFSTVSIKPFK